MAPNGHTATGARTSERSAQKEQRPEWLEKHGRVEFQAWQKEHPKQTLSYEEWSSKGSDHIAGPSLYYATLQIWDESDSSNEEDEQVKVESRPQGGRAQPSREPKKTLKTNGTGLTRSTGSATPSASAQADDVSPSAKKKRKARKKYLSQALVASDESEDEEAAEPVTGATTPSAPTIAVNGRQKSFAQKPRKTPISGDFIAPEDEEGDFMAMNGISTPAIASPLPVRSAPKPPVTEQASEPLKRTILKLSTRKAPKPSRKKILSEETVVDDDTDEGKAHPATAPSTATTVAQSSNAAATEKSTPLEAIKASHESNGRDSPDRPGESAAAAATRRGLRTRRPAQQNPYSYDAQIFEDDEVAKEDVPEDEAVAQPLPDVQSRRASLASLGKSYDEPNNHLNDESLAILMGEVAPDENFRRFKHYKGKGRAWKKDESDEDLEFNPGKKKAKAKAKAKTLQQQQKPGKKRGRPPKVRLSEDVVRDESDGDSIMTEDPSPSPPVWDAPAKRNRKPPRRSGLSEAIVRDDTDEEENDANGKIDEPTDNAPPVETATPVKRRVGRPRKSEQLAQPVAPKETKEEKDVLHTPKGTPAKSQPPKGAPKSGTPKGESQSYTPTGGHRQRSLSAGDVESADMEISDLEELDSDDDDPIVVSPSGIEAHMASVNAEDDDDDELSNEAQSSFLISCSEFAREK